MSKELMVVVPVSRLDWEATAIDLTQRAPLRRQVAAALLNAASELAATDRRVPVGATAIEVVESGEIDEWEMFAQEVRDHPGAYVFIRGRFDTKPIPRGPRRVH